MGWQDGEIVGGAGEAWKSGKPVTTTAGGGDPGRPTKGNGVLRRIDAGVRGVADFVTLGFADEAAAAADAVPELIRGGKDAFDRRYRENWLAQNQRDAADRRDVPVSRAAGQVAGFGATLGVGAISNSLMNAPRLLSPSAPLLARGAETVTRNALLGAGYGGAASAGAAGPDLADKGAAVPAGAGVGAVAGVVLPPAVAAAGAGVNRLLAPLLPQARRGTAAIAGRAGLNLDQVAAARARAAEINASGGRPPALVDVLDEGARGVIGAAATRQTPARQLAQDFADQRAADLQGRIAAQARRNVSPDTRSPQEIGRAIGKAQKTEADRGYSAVRNNELALGDDVVQALRTPDGKAAIKDAASSASRRLQHEDAARLNRLADDLLDQPGGTQITVGMADRISRTLLSKAQAAAARGDFDAASSLAGLGRTVRQSARLQVEGYDKAVTAYARRAKLKEAVTFGESILKTEADEFAERAAALTPEERQVARAAARRAIERAAGRPSSAPGVARDLATGTETRRKLEALLGRQDAAALTTGVATERRMAANAANIAPNTGSRTARLTQDQEAIGAVADAAGAVAGGPAGVVNFVVNRLRTAGMSDGDAEALVRMAIDPAQMEQALTLLERRLGSQGAHEIVTALRTAGDRTAGENVGRRRAPLEVTVTGETNPDYLQWRGGQ